MQTIPLSITEARLLSKLLNGNVNIAAVRVNGVLTSYYPGIEIDNPGFVPVFSQEESVKIRSIGRKLQKEVQYLSKS